MEPMSIMEWSIEIFSLNSKKAFENPVLGNFLYRIILSFLNFSNNGSDSNSFIRRLNSFSESLIILVKRVPNICLIVVFKLVNCDN